MNAKQIEHVHSELISVPENRYTVVAGTKFRDLLQRIEASDKSVLDLSDEISLLRTTLVFAAEKWSNVLDNENSTETEKLVAAGLVKNLTNSVGDLCIKAAKIANLSESYVHIRSINAMFSSLLTKLEEKGEDSETIKRITDALSDIELISEKDVKHAHEVEFKLD